jgi:hypothetical protein
LNVLERVKVKSPLLGISGLDQVGGIYGGGYSIQVKDALVMANVTGRNSVAGISAAGCGNTLIRVGYVGSVLAQKSAAGIDAAGCVLSISDSFAIGSARTTVNASDAIVSGMVVGGYLQNTIGTSYSMLTLQAATPSLATVGSVIGNYNSNGNFGQTTNKMTLSGVYYRKSLNASLVDALSVGLLDTELATASKYSGFDFTGTWSMPTQIPSGINNGKITPVPRLFCGQEGWVCP